MKVVYLHQYFNTPDMAGSTRSYEMARRLVKSGHQVEMVTTDRSEVQPVRGTSKWNETLVEGIHVHWLSVPYSNHYSYFRRIIAFFHFALSAARKSASLKGDIIFATSTPLTIALPAVYTSRVCKIPMVFEVRDLWPAIPIALGVIKNIFLIWAANWLEKFAYRNSSRIVALSPGMKDGILETGYPAEKIIVIPNSSDLDFFSENPSGGLKLREKHPWIGKRPLVIYTGALGLINGVDYMAKLAADVWELDPEIRFLVIGEGREKEFVQQKAIELGVLENNFKIWGSFPKKEIPEVLSAADVATSFVIDHPSLWANSANKFFDALASGTPIAINYQGWQADLLNGSGAGMVLDPNDIPGSAELLVELIRDPDWLKQARLSARKLAKERFSRDLLYKRLEAVLLDAIKYY